MPLPANHRCNERSPKYPTPSMNLTLICFAIATSLLAGCYETSVPILVTGERAGLAGRFLCKIDLKPDREAEYTEFKFELETGSSFFYLSNTGEFVQLKRKVNAKDVYIVQIEGSADLEESRVLLLFIKILPDGVMLLIPNMSDESTKALAMQHHVGISKRDGYFTKVLTGNTSDILSFLLDYDDNKLLPMPNKCSRRP